ncbi:hypothetical protein NMY22_g1128 [Coprinellus aureogranulatus]|nr:hypothetical protein NMY22_g1128 [Coprinellus aureogranulatus]
MCPTSSPSGSKDTDLDSDDLDNSGEQHMSRWEYIFTAEGAIDPRVQHFRDQAYENVSAADECPSDRRARAAVGAPDAGHPAPWINEHFDQIETLCIARLPRKETRHRQSPIDLTRLYDPRRDPISNAPIPFDNTIRYTAPHPIHTLVKHSSQISLDLRKRIPDHQDIHCIAPPEKSQSPTLALTSANIPESQCLRPAGVVDPFTLQDFLDDFEDMCRQYRVPDERMIDALFRIAPNYDTRAFWKCLASTMGAEQSWIEFRKLLVRQTPGADEDRRYTSADLAHLVRTSQGMSTLSMDDFSRLWTRFLAISEFLKSHGRISEGERSKKLLECLPSPLRMHVKAHLRRQDPRHHAEDPLPLKEVYEAIVFVLSIAQECFEDELVLRMQNTSPNGMHHSERGERLSHPFRESTKELSVSVERLGDTLKTLSNGPMGIDRNTNAIAKPKPTPSTQSFTLRHEVSATQSHGSCEPSRSTSQDVAHNDNDEYEAEDVPFFEAMLLNQARYTHNIRKTLEYACSRSAGGVQSMVNGVSEVRDHRSSRASSNLVANYIETASQDTINPQREPNTKSSHHAQIIAPDTSHTPSSPRNVYAEPNTLESIVSEQQVEPEKNEETALVVSKVMRTVDLTTSQVVQVVSDNSQRDLVASFVAIEPSIGPPSLSSIGLQPAFETVRSHSYSPLPITRNMLWTMERIWSPGTDPPISDSITFYPLTVSIFLLLTILLFNSKPYTFSSKSSFYTFVILLFCFVFTSYSSHPPLPFDADHSD